ncbi:YlcI/YnfO family protein [Dokdonella sp.]|uniref:YlcI/YnfO family protein n=1 Tax=Dokdonella sp. TaxID=2291710 RepID=UPI003BAE4974
MKTATLPSLRVEPEFRHAAESVLQQGESLSGLMEKSLRDEVTRRRNQAEFIARGLAARDEGKRSGVYHDADTVHAELRAMLVEAVAKAAGKAKA